jgi:restriction system protein
MSYYLIRIGAGSKYIEEAHKEEFVAIGWTELSDLTDLSDLDKIKKALVKQYSYTAVQLGMQAGQISRFLNEMQIGDIVLSRLEKNEYLIGEIKSGYYYEENNKSVCPYKHRRKVFWHKKTLLKDDMSSNLIYGLGGLQTIFSLKKYANELDNLITGKEISPAEKPDNIKDIILNGLLELDGKQFEEFIRDLLVIIGFETQTTQYVGDKGIDVNGILNAEGIAEITLRVQVKRIRTSIRNKDILAIRGALAQNEHACFITLSDFSKQAIEESEAPGKVPVKLIDGKDLTSIVLKHFDEIDDKYKKLFPIKKRKDFNIEDLFESDIPEPDMPENIKEKKAFKFNTLVCAAKEEGFKEAFLEQKAWWAVRVKKENLSAIKYLALYQVAPISAITYYGEVKEIKQYEETDKYIIYVHNTIKLKNTIKLGKNRYLKPQGPRYTTLTKVLKGKTLDDIF